MSTAEMSVISCSLLVSSTRVSKIGAVDTLVENAGLVLNGLFYSLLTLTFLFSSLLYMSSLVVMDLLVGDESQLFLMQVVFELIQSLSTSEMLLYSSLQTLSLLSNVIVDLPFHCLVQTLII